VDTITVAALFDLGAFGVDGAMFTADHPDARNYAELVRKLISHLVGAVSAQARKNGDGRCAAGRCISLASRRERAVVGINVNGTARLALRTREWRLPGDDPHPIHYRRVASKF
jgi:hypothetical protein